jgi:hypothetical protein
MKNTRFRLGACLLFASLTFQSYSQKETSNFTITPELSKRIIETNYMDVTVFHVTKKEIDYHTSDTTAKTKNEYKYLLGVIKEYAGFKDYNNSFQQRQYEDSVLKLEKIKQVIAEETKLNVIQKRMTYMLENSSINVNQLSGEYFELSKKYMCAISPIENKLIQNELSDDLRDNYNVSFEVLTKPYPLIQKVGTEDYYWIMSDEYISKIKFDQKMQELLDIVHKQGYKDYKDYDRIYIKTKTAEISLDMNFYSLLKQNLSFISKFDADQMKISALVQQTIPHSKTLDKYLSTYNIQRRNTSTATINSWRIATANAEKLSNQIFKLRELYDAKFSFGLLDKSNILDVFQENLNASKGVLKM